jgi:hypothetical protein
MKKTKVPQATRIAMKNPLRISARLLLPLLCLGLAPGPGAHAQQKEEDSGYQMPAPPRTFTQDELDAKIEAEKDACRARLEDREKTSAKQREEQMELERKINDSTRRVEICSKTASLADRVVCYDEIARDYGFKTLRDLKSQEQKIGQYGFWQVTHRINDMGDEVIYLKLDSVEPVVSRSGIRRTPTFTLRCVSKKTDVFLDWKATLTGNRNIKNIHVLYKIDSNPLVSGTWQLSEDNNAAFSPNAIEFIKSLTDRTKLVLIVTPFADRTATLIFPLKGLAPALDILVKRCYNAQNSGAPAPPSNAAPAQ